MVTLCEEEMGCWYRQFQASSCALIKLEFVGENSLESMSESLSLFNKCGSQVLEWKHKFRTKAQNLTINNCTDVPFLLKIVTWKF